MDIDKDDAAIAGPTSWGSVQLNHFTGFENFTLGGGNDVVEFGSAGTGDNVIHAGAGNDFLLPGDGNDTVYGEDGNDILEATAGSDVLSGGNGADIFVWEGLNSGAPKVGSETITDFNLSEDKLWLTDGVSIYWDPNSAVLHGTIVNDAGAVCGEVTLTGLTYGDAASITILHGLDASGLPLG